MTTKSKASAAQVKPEPKQPFIVHREAIVRLVNRETEARIGRIEREFADGFDMVNNHQYTVTIFGSARSPENGHDYQLARALAGELAEEGFSIVTGGGGGIMEAANRGAYEAGGKSIGMNIKLPHEQELNPFVTESMAFRYFFARKVMLVYAASALICFPGGFGTMDELFEVITLVQTGKMPRLPIILVGSNFWQPLDTLIRQQMLTGQGMISSGDEKLYTILDDIEAIKNIVVAHRDATAFLY